MDTDASMQSFHEAMNETTMTSSRTIAEETVKILIKLISNAEWQTAEELIAIVKKHGKCMIEAYPSQVVIGNSVKRVLKVIREEYVSALGKRDEIALQKSLRNLQVAEGQILYNKHFPALKESITDSLRELLSELETSQDNIAAQSLDYILSDTVIMTAGKSQAVEKFLKKAFSKKKFQVIVAEGAPFYHGHEMAKNLAQHGIETTLIHDRAVFAVMSRVHKVVISAHSVMADGGVKTSCGMHALALAAKYHSVPLIVCGSICKLTPQFLRSTDQPGFNHIMSPQDIMPFDDGELMSGVEILNPAYDYIRPELVSIYVSNIGDSSPSQIYKLLGEIYHSDDYDIP